MPFLSMINQQNISSKYGESTHKNILQKQGGNYNETWKWRNEKAYFPYIKSWKQWKIFSNEKRYDKHVNKVPLF